MLCTCTDQHMPAGGMYMRCASCLRCLHYRIFIRQCPLGPATRCYSWATDGAVGTAVVQKPLDNRGPSESYQVAANKVVETSTPLQYEAT